jgi:hypothetical protein
MVLEGAGARGERGLRLEIRTDPAAPLAVEEGHVRDPQRSARPRIRVCRDERLRRGDGCQAQLRHPGDIPPQLAEFRIQLEKVL